MAGQGQASLHLAFAIVGKEEEGGVKAGVEEKEVGVGVKEVEDEEEVRVEEAEKGGRETGRKRICTLFALCCYCYVYKISNGISICLLLLVEISVSFDLNV